MTLPSKRIVARNAMSGYLIYLTRIGLGFILTPFIIRSIGTAEYGLWLLTLSVTGYFFLADLGFGQAIVRYVAMQRVDGNQEQLNQLVSTFLVVYAAIGTVIGMLTLALTPVFPTIFRIPPDQVIKGQLVFLAIGFAVALSFPLNLFGGFLQGHQRYDLVNGIECFISLASGLLTVAVLLLGYGLLALVLISVAGNLMGGIVKAYLAIRLTPGLRLGLSHFRRAKIREIGSYSLYFFVVSTAVMVCHRSDQIVIGLFLPITAVAIYGVNLRLVELSRGMAGQIGNVLLPVAADLHARADRPRLQSLLKEGTKYGLGFMAAAAIQLLILGPPFLDLWVGAEFKDGYSALVVLTVISVAALVGDTAARILLVAEKQKVVALISIVDAIVNATLSIILVQRLGLVGVALGTAIPFLAVASFNTVYASRLLRLSINELLRSSFYPTLLAAIPAGAVLQGLVTWAYPDSWPTLFLEGLMGGLVYLLIFSYLGISGQQRQYCLATAIKRWPLAKRAID